MPDNARGERAEIYRVDLDPSQVNDPRIIASRMIPAGSTVLDMGCACGDFGVLLDRDKDCEVHGMEFDRESLAIAARSGAYRSLMQADLNQPGWSKELPAMRFDVIALLDVLEHLVNPQRVLDEVRALLKPGGHLVVSLPNLAFGDIKLQLLDDLFLYTRVGVLDETHLRFYTFNSIASQFASSGFRLSCVTPRLVDFTVPSCRGPVLLAAHVARNPHSFVFQYVFKAGVADASHELEADNLHRLNFTEWASGQQEVVRMRWTALKNIFLPYGSFRHRVLKRLLGTHGPR